VRQASNVQQVIEQPHEVLRLPLDHVELLDGARAVHLE